MTDRIAGALEAIASALLLSLVAVTVIDVVGRHVLGVPFRGAFELTELLLCALVFAALPLVSRAGGHVEVDLLVARIPPRAARVLGVIASAVSALALVYFAWRLVVVAEDLTGTRARSNALGIPFAPFAAFGAVGCIAAAILGMLREIRR